MAPARSRKAGTEPKSGWRVVAGRFRLATFLCRGLGLIGFEMGLGTGLNSQNETMDHSILVLNMSAGSDMRDGTR